MANAVDIKIRTAEYRPCYVNGRKALFHRWENHPRLLVWQDGLRLWTHEKLARTFAEYRESGVIPQGFSVEKIPQTVAIVEYEDGTVGEAEPCDVRFVPGLMNEYDFKEAVMNETGNDADPGE